MKKISYEEWVEMLAPPTACNIAEYSIEIEGDGPFEIYIGPDPQKVETPREKSMSSVMRLANDLSRAGRETNFLVRQLKRDKSPVLVSEMDSWGHYPFFLDETIDHLNKDYNVWSVGAAGDILENMVNGPKQYAGQEFMKALTDRKDEVEAFIFSAAGNDVLGVDRKTKRSVLLDMVKDFNNDPSDTQGHIDMCEADKRFGIIRAGYEKMISDIRADGNFDDLPILIHGYDYSFPFPWSADEVSGNGSRKKGKWLGPVFTTRGIPNDPLGRNIVITLLDRLYDMMHDLAGDSTQTNIWVADCRNTLTDVTDWRDEIHGTSEGFALIAKKFKQKLEQAGVPPKLTV